MELLYTRAAAAVIGLTIDDAHLNAVEEDVARAAAMAHSLMEFSLDQKTEAAPVFKP